MNNLKEIYSNVRSAPGYSSKIQKFLQQNESSSVFRQVRHKFPRRRIISRYPFQMIMSDTINYRLIERPYNRPYKYIMVAIDVFTKKAWAQPMKSMDQMDASVSMGKIIDQMPEIPQIIITDLGTEFYNKMMANLFNRLGVKHYSIRGKHKACVAERFIRTLKSRLQKYFWANNTTHWTNVLDNFIQNYNNTYHRSIKMSPNAVNEDNRAIVYKTLYPKSLETSKPRLSPGDRVRLIKEKKIFEKGYTRGWSTEIYQITKAFTQGTVDYYKVADLDGNTLPRTKYYWELNLVTKANAD